jgi:hypothetical protein
MTAGARRLFIFSNTLDIEILRYGCFQQFDGYVSIFRTDTEFCSANKVGDEPVHADHVVVAKETFDAGRFQGALSQERLGKVTKLFHHD